MELIFCLIVKNNNIGLKRKNKEKGRCPQASIVLRKDIRVVDERCIVYIVVIDSHSFSFLSLLK